MAFENTIDSWQERLLQLDLRNSRVNFRPRTTAVRIVGQDPCDLVEALTASRRGLSFNYVDPQPRRRAAFAQSTLPDDDAQQPEAEIKGDLATDLTTQELQRRLGNLRRRANEWRDEQGLSVLFLALGFLEWVTEDGSPALSPLLLLPCILDRRSPRTAFLLSAEDDTPTPNETLAFLLERDHDIRLPQLEADSEDCAAYIEAVRELVEHRTDWKVTDDVFLSIFAFSKLAMRHDLQGLKDGGSSNPIILAMTDAQAQTESTAQPSALPPLPEDLSGGKLDDLLELRDQYAVLPADYSQLKSIRAVRSGQNLVVHGPPGTGKSQTIANMIATLLGEGKTVLFVSEKSAALDVVKTRLEANQLGVFCLDLHSDRGRKANVYDQLRSAVEDRRRVTLRPFESTVEDLARMRSRLNAVVRELHKVRPPLGLTIYQVQGRLASLRDLPQVKFPVRAVGEMDREQLANFVESAGRIRMRQREFSEHETSHWRALRNATPTIELADSVRSDMHAIAATINSVSKAGASLADFLGLQDPSHLSEVGSMVELARHFSCAPGIPLHWAAEGEAERLLSIANQDWALQVKQRQLSGAIMSVMGDSPPGLDFEDLAGRIELTTKQRDALHYLLESLWVQRIVSHQGSLASSLQRLLESLLDLQRAAVRGAGLLSAREPENLKTLVWLLPTLSKLGQLELVPGRWVQQGGLDEATKVVQSGRMLAESLDEHEGRITPQFDPEVEQWVDQSTLQRYRTDYQGRLRRLLSGSYKADSRALRAHSRTGTRWTFEAEIRAVGDIVDLQRLRESWTSLEPSLTENLGRRFNGRNTDWKGVLSDIEVVRGLLDSISQAPAIPNCLQDADCLRNAQEIGASLSEAAQTLMATAQALLNEDRLQELQGGSLTFGELGALLENAMQGAERIEQVAQTLAAAKPVEIPDLQSLQTLISNGAQLRQLDRERNEAEREVREAGFGPYYTGLNTDWNAVEGALSWACQLGELSSTQPRTDRFDEHIIDPMPSEAYARNSDTAAETLEQARARLDGIGDGYDLRHTPFETWEDATFEDILTWTRELAEDADTALEWVRYSDAVDTLQAMLGQDVIPMIRSHDSAITSEQVPGIIERQVLTAWLAWVGHNVAEVSGFTVSEHEDTISKFKTLDGQLPLAARNEIRRRCFSRFPDMSARHSGRSEVGILQKELTKKRRQWPVRRLLEAIAQTVQSLKPCFLVSPLAVSQFLPQGLMFDVVIFDEASQVFPEDSIPAIMRGRQVVVAGDQQQLPPTSFFQKVQDLDDDLDSSDDDDALEGQESILDTAVGLIGRCFSEEHLNVHYRSQDEDLIRFSNHYFYRDKLLTFPSPRQLDTWQGLKDVYVPEGRYDAGGTRTNRIEAEKVVDLVIRHMRERPPTESLGVVALSRPQADLIERLLEERRVLERDVEGRFSAGGNEPFFVKNLETVQGDERDHIILSVGYGPTVGSGAVPNRFGPINAKGGERRLNVVVTRAKQRIDLVHSLRATDIVSEQPGARLLRRYLEYVEDPFGYIEGQVTEDPAAESESPFEEAVERALIARGHKVARQVGVSGYRIDLAIASEASTGYDLGIECDGSQYHSAPAARDRDWLRQQVLEGLGWKIHRVWSTAWIENPQREIGRIEEALKAARANRMISNGAAGSDLEVESDHAEAELEHSPFVDADPIPFEDARALQQTHDETALDVTVGSEQAHMEDMFESEPLPQGASLVWRLTSLGLTTIDKRPSGGVLWIVGGQDLKPKLEALAGEGIRFTFAPKGGQATRRRPAWFTRTAG